MNLEKLRILIVGAGISGLALARALRQRGTDPDIIERHAGWKDTGTGMYLPGNALRALRVLDLDGEVTRHGALIRTQKFCNGSGKLLSEVDLDAVWNTTGPCVGIHRADLHEILRTAKNAPPVRMGVSLVTLDQTGGAARAQLSDGTSDTYDLVVGADRIRSTVRRLAFDDTGLRPLNQQGWRFVMPCPPNIATWSVWIGRKSACLVIPIGGGRAYCYVDLMGTETSLKAESSTDRLCKVLAEFAGLGRAILEGLDGGVEIHAAAMEEVVLERWSAGQILLVGDAAHAMSPNMAQGAAMGFEDALVLTDSLADQATIETALSAYEARRRPRVDWALAMTHRRDRVRRLHPLLRNGLLKVFGQRTYHSHYRPLLTQP